MTKANECTCPSGDGSLRHPCPAHPTSVELAGVAAKLTFINGRPAMCGCQVEYSSGGGEYSDVIYVTLCAKHSGSAILDLVATNRIALTPEYEGQWHADLYLDREAPLAKAEGATPAEAVLALMSAERIDPEQESVEQAGGDERDLQGAQGERDGWGPFPIVQVPWNVFDRAVMWVEDRRRYGDDGTIVDDWKALKTIQRAALAQPSPAQTQPSPAPTLRAAIDVANDRFEVPVAKWGTDLVGEEERPEVAEVAFVLRNIGAMDAEDIDGDNVDLRFEDAEGRDTGCDVSIVEYAEKAADLFEQHDRIVGELRADRDSWAEQAEQRLADWDEMRKERDAALAEVERLRESKGDPVGSLEKCMKVMYERDEHAKRLEAALARVAELEKELAMACDAAAKGDAARHAAGGMEMEIQELREKVTELQKELRSRWTYASTQATNCAGCGEYKHTPLRVDWMGGYVCLTCIDKKLEELHDDQAQHSVPEGWMLVECGIWTQEQVDEMQKTVARFRNSEFVDDRALAMAVADAGQCKAPEISLAELLAAAPGKEGV
ncbi:TPA: hypothetical protein OTX76_000947 [Pseudomonas aeruginosa]|nr:hypothetical protein [Pseudomonas aeruginosa]HCU2376023.1 hypothetical protein [Pseudomonas aeruginosa]